MKNKQLQILFVCTGNVCRSAMAEGILKKMIAENYKDLIIVKSAGTNTITSMSATAFSQEAAKDNGINISSHRSKPLTESLAAKNDLIFVMTQEHIEFIKAYFMKHLDKVYALKKFNKPKVKNIDIDDPIGGSLNSYKKIFKEINKEIERIFPTLIKIVQGL